MNRFKNQKWKIIITSIISLCPTILGLLFWNELPEQIPTHYGINGPDAYGPKSFYVFFFGGLMLLIHIGLLYFTGKDPKNANVSDRVMSITIWAVPVVSLFTSLTLYAQALNWPLEINRAVNILMAVIFLVAGNYLPKCRQNHTIGIRLPWTLRDADNWNRTHRLGGYVFMAAGALLLLALLLPKSWFAGFSLFVTLCAVLLPVIYSYSLSRRRESK